MLRVILSITAVALLAASSVAAEPKKVALLVGVNQYDKRGFRPLAFAERDVDELGKLLRRSGYEVTTLTGGGDGDRRATLANVQKQLDRALTGRNQVDMVLIGLAGHGFQIDVDAGNGARQADAFFCPVDAEKGNHLTMFSIGGLLDELDRRGGGTNLLLVDACREDPTRGRGLDGSTVKTLPEGTAVLFGCRAGQKTFESENAGGGHGVFFHFVIEGLAGKAVNSQGAVTWSSLADYVTERVVADTAQLLDDENATQVPNDLRNLPGVSPVLARVDLPAVPPPPTNTPPPAAMPKPSPLPIPANLQSTTNSIGMKLILIPAGEFQMGSPAGDSDAFDDEKPQHRVRNTKPFYLGQTEVTQAQWQAVMGTTPWSGQSFVKEGPDYPATYVSHDDAAEFCRKLSEKEGKTYRLPTEAEWEYACRAGTTTKYHFGDDATLLRDYAWFYDNAYSTSEKYAHQVGQKKPNAWGLYDMHGNVWEWCYDWYDSGFYAQSRVDDPAGVASGSDRVDRGGGWDGSPRYCRSATRSRRAPGYRSINLGFRPALVH